jgi:pilus assembly protein CpaC
MRTHYKPTAALSTGFKPAVIALAVGASLVPAALAQSTAGPAQRLAQASPAQAASARVTTEVLPTAPCGRVEIAPVVQVSAGKSTVLRPANPIRRVLLGSAEGSRAARPVEAKGKEDDSSGRGGEDKLRPGVAEIDVLLLSPTEVYVLGRSIGSTNVVLIDDRGQCTAFDVVVGMDTGALQTVIGQLLPEEKNIRVSAAFDSVVLTGAVTDAGAVTRVMDLANAYVRGSGGGNGASVAGANPRIVNMLSTGAPQQVMLEVKVAEVSKALLDKWGINFSRAVLTGAGTASVLNGIFGGVGGLLGQVGGVEAGGRLVGTISGSIGSNGQAGSEFSAPVVRTPRGIEPALGTNVKQLGVDAQKTDGLVKILAEPTVMAISGQKGSFLAGGKIFIPVSQETSGASRTVTLEEKTFGVSVAFLPTVLSGDRINLDVATEVSELNRDGVGISAPGVSGLAVLPSFTSRKAQTTVQLLDGQSFAIGGLIKNNSTTNIKAFPFLGELPIVGALFRSSEFVTDKSELVFVITPRLVKPLPADYKLPTDSYIPPSRTDLHLNGRLEGQPPAPSAPPPAPAAPTAAATTPPEAPAAPAAGGFQVK